MNIEATYKKFAAYIKKWNLINEKTKKIVIGSSGGKDANTMIYFLNEYRNREGIDVELEIANIAIPEWKYKPELFLDKLTDDKKEILLQSQREIEAHISYWAERGVKTVQLNGVDGFESEKIYNSLNPCVYCFMFTKKALFKYLESHDDPDSVCLAFGLTKWDIVYALLSQILWTSGKLLDEIKKEQPIKYDMIKTHIASFSPYPKIDIGVPGHKVYCIQPILCLSDMETRQLCAQSDFPIIQDTCSKLHGEKFQSDKRFFDQFLKNCASELAIQEYNEKSRKDPSFEKTLDPLFSDYDRLIEIYNKIGILPAREEIDGILYDSFFNETMGNIVEKE